MNAPLVRRLSVLVVWVLAVVDMHVAQSSSTGNLASAMPWVLAWLVLTIPAVGLSFVLMAPVTDNSEGHRFRWIAVGITAAHALATTWALTA